MKKFLFSSFLVASLASSLFGADLLASLTNGKISDNSPCVKVLSLEEAKQVKGGYYLTKYTRNLLAILSIIILSLIITRSWHLDEQLMIQCMLDTGLCQMARKIIT